MLRRPPRGIDAREVPGQIRGKDVLSNDEEVQYEAEIEIRDDSKFVDQ